MPRLLHLGSAFLAVALNLLSTPSVAASNPDWTTPLAPFRIADNLFYVGSRDLAAFLVVTPAGDILINSNLQSSVPQIRHSVEVLGFRFSDIKILLISHAHFDHAAGSADVLRLTGARYMVMDDDVPVVESGGAADFRYGRSGTRYPRAHVSRILHDGDLVNLGNTTLVAHKTPGHTRGCTTWTTVTSDRGRPLNAVIVGSWNTNSFPLVDTPAHPAAYPGIARDFEHTFDVLEHLPCDLFLGAHGSYFGMLGKLAASPAAGRNVWIDPAGYRAAVAERKSAFLRELQQQQLAASR